MLKSAKFCSNFLAQYVWVPVSCLVAVTGKGASMFGRGGDTPPPDSATTTVNLSGLPIKYTNHLNWDTCNGNTCQICGQSGNTL